MQKKKSNSYVVGQNPYFYMIVLLLGYLARRSSPCTHVSMNSVVCLSSKSVSTWRQEHCNSYLDAHEKICPLSFRVNISLISPLLSNLELHRERGELHKIHFFSSRAGAETRHTANFSYLIFFSHFREHLLSGLASDGLQKTCVIIPPGKSSWGVLLQISDSRTLHMALVDFHDWKLFLTILLLPPTSRISWQENTHTHSDPCGLDNSRC